MGVDAMLFRRSTLRLNRAGGFVIGLPAGPVPSGRGAIVVAAQRRPPKVRRATKLGSRRRKRGQADPPTGRLGSLPTERAPAWLIRWEDGDEQMMIFDHCGDVDAVRECALGLAEIGQWELRWQSEGDRHPEVRSADQLRVSVGERVKREPTLLPRAEPVRRSVTLSETDAGGLSVVFPDPARVWRGQAPVVPALVATTPSLVGMVAGTNAFAGTLGLIGLGLGVASVAARIAWVARVEIAKHQVTLYRRHLPLLQETPWTSVTGDVQTIRLEVTPVPRLVMVIGGSHVGMGEGIDLGELRWVRAAMVSALAGKDLVAGAFADAELNAPLAGSPLPSGAPDVICPTCADSRMGHVGGPLDEHVCVGCQGRFSTQVGAVRLAEEMGWDPAMLRDLAAMYAGDRLSCPGCRSPMSAVQLKGVRIDLCTGCGGMWFGAGELGRMTQGRYAG